MFHSAIGHFRVPQGLCFKTRVGAHRSAFDMEIIFHSHANKSHFLKKCCAPNLILKVSVFGTRKWPIGRNTDPVFSATSMANRPFPSCPKLLFQSEANCEATDIKKIFFILVHIKPIFTRKVWHLASL